MNSLAYQDDFEQKRCQELIDGVIVMMSPRPTVDHNRVAYNIATLFDVYLHGKKCVPFSDGVDLFLDEKNRFVPDFMIVCDPEKIKPNGVYGTPDLVAEVLSPTTMKNDRSVKKEIYARCGVKEYWLADPSNKTVEIYYGDGGAFALHDIYVLPMDWQLAQMTEEERRRLVAHFKCSLFDDLDIALEDIFYRTF